MKKRMKLICMSCILIAFVAVSIYQINISKNGKEVKINANYINQKDNIKDIINSSEIIVVGTVKSSNSYELSKAVFTNYTISVEKVLKKSSNFSIGEQIDVRLTGGQINGVNYVLEDTKYLNKNDTYMFMLEKTYPEDKNSNVYTPIGSYQGIISLDKASGKFKEFNKNNKIEKDILNKNTQNIMDINQ